MRIDHFFKGPKIRKMPAFIYSNYGIHIFYKSPNFDVANIKCFTVYYMTFGVL